MSFRRPFQDAPARLRRWRRIDVIAELPMRKFDELRNELVAPWRVSRQVHALRNDGPRVDAKARGLRTAVRVNRYHKLGELWKFALQLRDQRVAVGGAFDDYSDRFILLP
jgi:hypothetical protein